MKFAIALEAGRAVEAVYDRTRLVGRCRSRKCRLFQKTDSIVDAVKDRKARGIECGPIALAVLEDAIGPEGDACATWPLIIALRLRSFVSTSSLQPQPRTDLARAAEFACSYGALPRVR